MAVFQSAGSGLSFSEQLSAGSPDLRGPDTSTPEAIYQSDPWDPLSLAGGGQSTELYLEYDPAVLDGVRGHRQSPNSGCPPNYAAEFVAPGTAMAIAYDPASPGSTWIRCRYVPGISADQIQAETGTSLGEQVGIVTGAVGDTIQQAQQKVKDILPGLGIGLGGLGLIAAAVVFILYGPRFR